MAARPSISAAPRASSWTVSHAPSSARLSPSITVSNFCCVGSMKGPLMATVREIRALWQRRGPAPDWHDIHVSPEEFDPLSFLEWAEYLGRSAHPWGNGFGMYAAGLSRASRIASDAEYAREEIPLMACLNCDDPDGEKDRKIVAYFRELIPEYYRGIEKDLEGRRLVAAHASYLPIVRTSTFIFDHESGE